MTLSVQAPHAAGEGEGEENIKLKNVNERVTPVKLKHPESPSLNSNSLDSADSNSRVGGSPGLKILNISNNASSLERALSNCKVFLM